MWPGGEQRFSEEPSASNDLHEIKPNDIGHSLGLSCITNRQPDFFVSYTSDPRYLSIKFS